MDRDELKDDIIGVLEEVDACRMFPDEYLQRYAESIIVLIAPELEKARKWDMVETIAENNCFPCPLKNSKCISCDPRIIHNIIKAIEGEISESA